MSTDVTRAPERNPAEAAPEATRSRPVWRPLTDIVETKDGIQVIVELPGVSPQDVDLTVEKRVLTIRARAQTIEPERLRLVHAEYQPGDFERAFTFSDEFDLERIDAQMKNGVLTLTVPRTEATRPKSITIKAG